MLQVSLAYILPIIIGFFALLQIVTIRRHQSVENVSSILVIITKICTCLFLIYFGYHHQLDKAIILNIFALFIVIWLFYLRLVTAKKVEPHLTTHEVE